MAKNSIRDYDATSGNNTDVQSVDISEGCAASGINNALREIMTDLKNVSTGAVALETPAADQLNVDNLRIDGNTISSTDTNGNITLDPNGTGAIELYQNNTKRIETSSTGVDVTGLVKTSNAYQVWLGANVLGSNGGLTSIGSNPIVIGTDGTERMRIESSGNIKISDKFRFTAGGDFEAPATGFSQGTNSKQFAAAIIYSSRSSTVASAHIAFYNPNGEVGTITTSSSSTNYNTSSDHRLKENVADMTGAIARVKQLAPKRFNFIADDSVTVDGFLAHEAQTVVPEAVHGTHNEVDDDGNAVMQGIDQSKLVPLLVGALKESIAKIETLETQRADLEARLTALENA